MRIVLLAAAAVLALSGAAAAQQSKTVQQKITPPESRYWMGATTGAGFMSFGAGAGGGFGMGDALRMASGGMPEFSQSVELRLGSALAASGAPEATHAFPAGAQVNQPIFLETPKPGTPTRPGRAEEPPYEKPKGRIKFFWGCGEKAPAGQPVVLDFEKLANGVIPDADLGAGVDVNEVRKPTEATSRTYGAYPNGHARNARLTARFGAGASLAGEHKITGTYTPPIGFKLARSFMEPVRYTATSRAASGAVPMAWTPIGRATGYSLAVIGGRDGGARAAEMVIWSSSQLPATFIMHEDLAPAEVARLIKLKAVLPPTQTSCAIPAEVIAELGKAGGGRGGPGEGGAMLAFTAFGDQETFIHPPRPADPKVTWDQEWFARTSYKSIRMDMLTPDGVTDMGAMMAGAAPGRGPAPAGETDAQYCARIARERAERPSGGQMIGEATGIPGAGMLGKALAKRGKPAEPVDPRCVKK